jgi:hypothetical protein
MNLCKFFLLLTQGVNMNKPSVLNRAILTFVVGMAIYWVAQFMTAAMPSVEAAVAAQQVRDSIATYAAAQSFIRGNALSVWLLAWLIFIGISLFIWKDVLKFHFGQSDDDGDGRGTE